MTESTPVTRALDALAIPYRLFRHPGPVHSLEQAAAERGQAPGQIVRSLLFRVGRQGYVMVLVAGPGQISWPALRRRLSVNRVRMARPEEVRKVTGYEIGGVAPFGFQPLTPVIVDASVLAQEEVSIGSGVRGTTVILRREDLLRGLGEAPVVDLQQRGPSPGA